MMSSIPPVSDDFLDACCKADETLFAQLAALLADSDTYDTPPHTVTELLTRAGIESPWTKAQYDAAVVALVDHLYASER